MNEAKSRVATYERVSSEDQKQRETILNQTEELAQRLAADPKVILVGRYQDNGVSGSIDMTKRDGGRRLLDDAQRHMFDELWVYKIDRLGRDFVDPLVVWRDLDRLGIKVVSATESVSTPFEYSIRVAMAAEERRNIIQRTTSGMNRAARLGLYTGGIVPYGYRVEGERPNARLVPSDEVAWGDLTYAEIVRRMYRRIGVDRVSCRRVAEDQNEMGVPTAYTRDGRGIRGKRTSGEWTAGRVRNVIVQPIYRGELLYGRRSKKERTVIKASVEPLVSQKLWDAAQATLGANRIMAKNTTRTYFLRSMIRCNTCGLNYCGAKCRSDVRYRCDGGLIWRGPLKGRCKSKSFYGRELEPQVRADLELWLRNPGELLSDLALDADQTAGAAQVEAERAVLKSGLLQKRTERDWLLDGFQSGLIPKDKLKERLDELAEQESALERMLGESESVVAEPPPISEGLLAEIRQRLDDGLDEEQWREIASILTDGIVIHSQGDDPRTKTARAVISYRFPDVVLTHTGRGSWPSPA
jgi:site-specific DNA recombinase